MTPSNTTVAVTVPTAFAGRPLVADIVTVSGSQYTDRAGHLVFDGTEANDYADYDGLSWDLDMLEMSDWDGTPISTRPPADPSRWWSRWTSPRPSPHP